MHTLIAIVFVAVLVVLLGRAIGSARAGSWAGPRTPAMRTRAASPRTPAKGRGKAVLRSAGTAAGSAGAAVLRPSNGAIRAQARADAHRLWQEAGAANWLEEQRHARENGTAAPAGAATAPATRPTVAQRLRLRPYTAQAPGTASGGSPPAGSPPPAPAWPPVLKPANRTSPGQGNGGPPARPSPPPASPAANGGTPVAAGTSTSSAEKAIEGINEIHAHAAAGGIHAKREAVKALHEVDIRVAAMKLMLSRQMSEPGMNYGPEITEPLARSAQHSQAAAMSDSESDAALSTLINITVGELATSPRQAPHNAELSETGAR